MTYLDEILTDIHTIEKTIFNFQDELENTMAKIEDIHFQGQVDHNNLYMTMLHQIRNDKTGEIHTLTPEESDQFYLSGNISGWDNFKPFAWTFWFFNLSKNYVRALVSYRADNSKTPKDNYGIMYNELKPNVARSIPRKVIYETTVEESGYKEIWLKLKEVIAYGKNNQIKTGGFHLKITYDTSLVWGNKKHDELSILDDEYKETMRPEIIKIPVKHIPQDITSDKGTLNIIRGTIFKQVDFEGDGYIKNFDTIADMNSYLYSLIDYINSGTEKEIKNQRIRAIEKHYFSNKLPSPAPGTEYTDSEKIYKVKITKFLGQVVIEAEVSEFGIYYTLSNFNGKTFCEIL